MNNFSEQNPSPENPDPKNFGSEKKPESETEKKENKNLFGLTDEQIDELYKKDPKRPFDN